MIHQEKLIHAIEEYKKVFVQRWEDEKYKWDAIEHFNKHWDIHAEDFATMFAKATEKTFNLLASAKTFPRGMIIEFAKADNEAVRVMFSNLYDENIALVERVEKFQVTVENIRLKYNQGNWQQHFQSSMAISVYLWLKNPEKYYIFKYAACRAVATELEFEFIPKKGYTAENFIRNAKLLDEIGSVIEQEKELVDLYYETLQKSGYEKHSIKNLTFDFVIFFANTLLGKQKKQKDDTSEYEIENTNVSTIESEHKIENMSAIESEHTTNVIYTKKEFLEEVFMTSECYDTLVQVLFHKKNIILQGAPGVGKTFIAKRLAYSIMGEKDESRIALIQFHQNYCYEDFIMGYKPKGDSFELKEGIFYQFCKKAERTPEQNYFFLVDEINRGNMSKIFGELLMLIEKDYRGTSITLAYDGQSFSVPKNLYIIGMMNTADRSLAMIDYALRRRFSFFEIEPAFTSDNFISYVKSFENETFLSFIEKIKRLNIEIKNDSALGSGFQIGHSYFCGQKEYKKEWLQSIVNYEIIPLLQEYWFDEPKKVSKWYEEFMLLFRSY